ncbi:hypothetical protein T492DRAFT_187506 [Pavlovales sp. CCMP2436]|nr:hypothetical protein T492DRAFT_187506 [Pavlovales sp. CCMP2436]
MRAFGPAINDQRQRYPPYALSTHVPPTVQIGGMVHGITPDAETLGPMGPRDAVRTDPVTASAQILPMDVDLRAATRFFCTQPSRARIVHAARAQRVEVGCSGASTLLHTLPAASRKPAGLRAHTPRRAQREIGGRVFEFGHYIYDRDSSLRLTVLNVVLV